MIDREQFKALATQFRDLQDANKENVSKFLENVEAKGIDRGGLRRFVAWKRKDSEKRAQQEAIDQQCLYLAGERDTPADLPIGCELYRALHCFRRNMTVLQAAEELGVSNGKAGKLRQLARMFDTSIHTKVDGCRKPKLDVITPPEVAALPAHDADGVVIESPAAKASDAESPQGSLTSTDLAGAAGGVDAPAPIPESCGGELTGPDTKPGALATSPEPEVAPGPQDPIEEVSHDAGHLVAEPGVARAVPPATDPAVNGAAYERPHVDATAYTGDQRAAEPVTPEANCAKDLAPEMGDQPATSAPATDFTDKIKALSLSISPREPLPAEAFKTAAQLWDEVGEQPLCLRRSA
jgi:uncharacterized protein (UPF0335 family)